MKVRLLLINDSLGENKVVDAVVIEPSSANPTKPISDVALVYWMN